MKIDLKRSFELSVFFGLLYLWTPLSSVYAQSYIFDNGKLRFGNGTEHSLNQYGNLLQPFYYSSQSDEYYKLTYSTYPLDIAIGIGQNTDHWTGSTVIESPVIQDPTLDVSEFVTTVEVAQGNQGHGTLKMSGWINLNETAVGFSQTYTLRENASYIQVVTELINRTPNQIDSLHIWVGTRDDWVGVADTPTKIKGNLVEQDDGTFAFEEIENPAELAEAIQINSGEEGVLFYSITDHTNTSISSCCSSHLRGSGTSKLQPCWVL